MTALSLLVQINHAGYWGRYTRSKGVLAEALGYIPGMITHSIDLPIKAALTVIYALASIIITVGSVLLNLFTLGKLPEAKELVKKSWLLVVDTFMVVGVDCLGFVVPPLAYRIDEYILDHFSTKLGCDQNFYRLVFISH